MGLGRSLHGAYYTAQSTKQEHHMKPPLQGGLAAKIKQETPPAQLSQKQ